MSVGRMRRRVNGGTHGADLIMNRNVKLEPWRTQHAQPILDLLMAEGDELVRREPWRPLDFLTLSGQQRRAAAIEALVADEKGAHFVILVDNDVVGTVGLDWAAADLTPGEAQIGYWIARCYRRQGFATVAVRLALDEAVQLGYGRVRANVASKNEASIALLQRLGFSREPETIQMENDTRAHLRFSRWLTLVELSRPHR